MPKITNNSNRITILCFTTFLPVGDKEKYVRQMDSVLFSLGIEFDWFYRQLVVLHNLIVR